MSLPNLESAILLSETNGIELKILTNPNVAEIDVLESVVSHVESFYQDFTGDQKLSIDRSKRHILGEGDHQEFAYDVTHNDSIYGVKVAPLGRSSSDQVPYCSTYRVSLLQAHIDPFTQYTERSGIKVEKPKKEKFIEQQPESKPKVPQ